MKSTVLTIIAALFATHAFAVEIPKRAQKRILAAAPQLDLNSDGVVTAEELTAGRDKLPESLRAMLDAYLNSQGDQRILRPSVSFETTGPVEVEIARANNVMAREYQLALPAVIKLEAELAATRKRPERARKRS